MAAAHRRELIADRFERQLGIATCQQGGPIPAGLHTVTANLHVIGTDRLIDFMKRVFGFLAKRLERADGQPSAAARRRA